jgi:hypothetical protein
VRARVRNSMHACMRGLNVRSVCARVCCMMPHSVTNFGAVRAVPGGDVQRGGSAMHCSSCTCVFDCERMLCVRTRLLHARPKLTWRAGWTVWCNRCRTDTGSATFCPVVRTLNVFLCVVCTCSCRVCMRLHALRVCVYILCIYIYIVCVLCAFVCGCLSVLLCLRVCAVTVVLVGTVT